MTSELSRQERSSLYRELAVLSNTDTGCLLSLDEAGLKKIVGERYNRNQEQALLLIRDQEFLKASVQNEDLYYGLKWAAIRNIKDEKFLGSDWGLGSDGGAEKQRQRLICLRDAKVLLDKYLMSDDPFLHQLKLALDEYEDDRREFVELICVEKAWRYRTEELDQIQRSVERETIKDTQGVIADQWKKNTATIQEIRRLGNLILGKVRKRESYVSKKLENSEELFFFAKNRLEIELGRGALSGKINTATVLGSIDEEKINAI